jgi:hypothetical protein
MRTTVILPDALAESAKRRAAEDGTTLTSLIEEGLRMVLTAPQSWPPVDLPVHAGGGRVLVDILDKDALWQALDEHEAP